MSLYLTGRHHSGEVREAARHAVKSLRERARVDTQTAELLRAIGAGADQRRHEWLWTAAEPAFPKPVRNDVPTIIELLASGDAREREDAFHALFRTDRHVSRAVFDEIERKAASGNARERRHAAAALRRIEERQGTAA
jgi:HEAT repeat protein